MQRGGAAEKKVIANMKEGMRGGRGHMVVHGEAATDTLLTSLTKKRGSAAKQLRSGWSLGKENAGKMKAIWCPARELQDKEGDVKSWTENWNDIKETKISERGKAAAYQPVMPVFHYAEGSK